METKEAQLNSIKESLQPYKKVMLEASDIIVDQGVTIYPIFVITKKNIPIGIPLVTEPIDKAGWLINASSLEEFSTKQLIDAEKVDGFRKIYGDQKKRICLFIIADFGATFVFLPQ